MTEVSAMQSNLCRYDFEIRGKWGLVRKVPSVQFWRCSSLVNATERPRWTEPSALQTNTQDLICTFEELETISKY